MPEAISERYVSYVETVGKHDEGPPAPLDIVFYGYAAIFNLERDHPCFPRWLAMVKTSERQRATVVFTHTIAGMRIRSVEPGDAIMGIVEELLQGLPDNSVGFTLPDYAGIFVIPNDHPQRMDWLRLVHKSKNEKMKIVFAYDAYHDRVTSLEPAKD